MNPSLSLKKPSSSPTSKSQISNGVKNILWIIFVLKPIRQGFLNFFALRNLKGQKKIPRNPKVPITLLDPRKRGANRCKTLLLLSLRTPLDQSCPTHSPIATCGEWPFKCGEWLFPNNPKFVYLGQNEAKRIFTYNSHFKHQNNVKDLKKTVKNYGYSFRDFKKLWQMAVIIRYNNCGERKNSAGVDPTKLSFFRFSDFCC